MANSRFGYVRQYELSDALLPGTFLVVRLDGKGFHRFSDKHGFEKPNDRRALDLMNAAACRTIQSDTLRQHVLLAFGESDEYSFLLGPKCSLFGRRNRFAAHGFQLDRTSENADIYTSGIAKSSRPSCQSLRLRMSSYGTNSSQICRYKRMTGDQALMDGGCTFMLLSFQFSSFAESPCSSIVQYPGRQEIIDYFKWRQADSECM